MQILVYSGCHMSEIYLFYGFKSLELEKILLERMKVSQGGTQDTQMQCLARTVKFEGYIYCHNCAQQSIISKI